jgi:hypothetical protein
MVERPAFAAPSASGGSGHEQRVFLLFHFSERAVRLQKSVIAGDDVPSLAGLGVLEQAEDGAEIAEDLYRTPVAPASGSIPKHADPQTGSVIKQTKTGVAAPAISLRLERPTSS